MRIDKFAAEQTGISRSDAKELIKRRKITVNGALVTSADMHVDPEKDEIIIGGKPILYRQYMYIMLDETMARESLPNSASASFAATSALLTIRQITRVSLCFMTALFMNWRAKYMSSVAITAAP